MAARRILILIAVLMGISALSVAVAPPPRESRESSSQDAPSDPPAAGGSIISRTISVEAPQAPTISVPVGSTLALTVESKSLGAIEIEGLDRFAPLAPETPAEIEILADTAGTYPVRLTAGNLEEQRLVGRIEVTAPE